MKANLSLKRERELRGWSQAKVAEELGTDSITVSRWERGLSRPSPHFREKLCVLFNKNADELGLLSHGTEVSRVNSSATSLLQNTEPSVEPHIQDPAIPSLPENTVELVGRAALLEQLKQRLCTNKTSVSVALNGLPGVGKTALAVALARDKQIQQHFSEGILWAGPGPNPNIAGLLSRWGKLLGIALTAKETSLMEWEWANAIRDAIGNRRMLLVIDDAWQIETAFAFHVGGPHCAYLLTTRFPPLAASFDTQRAMLVPELDEGDGVALLARFAPQVVGQDPENARALVRSVGALPLALTLMGKYLRTLSSTGQPRRLYTALMHLRDAEYRLQLAEQPTILARPQYLSEGSPISLQASIAVSDQQLDNPAHAALYALSVFAPKPHTFSEEAALSVSQVPVDVLDTLSDAGLLENSGPGRYSLHQTVADYGRVHLNRAQARERLVAYGINYAVIHGTDEDALEQESSTILAALEAAYELGKQEELVQGVCAMAPFLYARGLYSLSERHLQRACQAATLLGDVRGIAYTLLYSGQIQLQWGEHSRAEASLQEGLGLARELRDEELMSALFTELAWLASAQGNFEQAEIYCQEGLILARNLHHQERIGTLLVILAWGAFERRNSIQALAFAQEALTLARQCNIHYGIPFALVVLGWIATGQGNYAEAETYFQEGLAVARQRHNLYASSLLLQGQGWLAEKRGDNVLAGARYQEALALSRQLYKHESIYRFLASLGRLMEKQSKNAEAEVYYQEALTLARDQGKPQFVVAILARMGNLLLKKQQAEAARTLFQEILNLHPELPTDVLAKAYYGLARAEAMQGHNDEARRLGEMSLAAFEALGYATTGEVRNWLEQI